jgi:hypothetical protein
MQRHGVNRWHTRTSDSATPSFTPGTGAVPDPDKLKPILPITLDSR